MFALDIPQANLNEVQPISQSEFIMMTPHQYLTNAVAVVIDDEPLILDATRAFLECWGYTVIAVTNTQEALIQLADGPYSPDIIICDYLLPESENGISVIAALRAAFNREIPAILITGVTSLEHIKMMRASALPVMRKPLDHDKLRTVLSQLISLNCAE